MRLVEKKDSFMCAKQEQYETLLKRANRELIEGEKQKLAFSTNRSHTHDTTEDSYSALSMVSNACIIILIANS